MPEYLGNLNYFRMGDVSKGKAPRLMVSASPFAGAGTFVPIGADQWTSWNPFTGDAPLMSGLKIRGESEPDGSPKRLHVEILGSMKGKWERSQYLKLAMDEFLISNVGSVLVWDWTGDRAPDAKLEKYWDVGWTTVARNAGGTFLAWAVVNAILLR